VIPLAGVLVLVALGLLALGLADADTTLQWASVGVSAAAAAVLALVALRARRSPERAGRGAPPDADAPLRMTTQPPGPPTGRAAGPTTGPTAGLTAGPPPAAPPAVAPTRAARTRADGEPPVEDVEVTDLLLVVDLRDDVLVVDEHPRYHRDGCPLLAGAEAVPLPVREARADGFTPCGTCRPDRHLAEAVRARRAGRRP
jgi:hypothetical protein